MNPPSNWCLDITHTNKNQFEKFHKKHPREYESLFANLHKIFTLLMDGNKIGGFGVGFFRSEGDGLYRIGQTSVPHSLESRLYIYPDTEALILYILDIGEKSGQQQDIKKSKQKIEDIKKSSST